VEVNLLNWKGIFPRIFLGCGVKGEKSWTSFWEGLGLSPEMKEGFNIDF
jgi:hypothetical protein